MTLPSRLILLLTLLAVPLWFAGNAAAAQTVSLPITVDHSLLRNMIVQQAFTGPNESAVVVREGGGCVNLLLSRPAVSGVRGLLRLEMDLFVQVGTPLGDQCLTPLQWQGRLVLFKRPQVVPDSWQLRFSLVDAQLLDAGGRPVTIANLLWSLVQERALSYIDDVVIDLAPPVNDLRGFLLPLFPEEVQGQTQKTLDSLRPGAVTVGDDALELEVLAEVDQVYEPGDDRLETPLDGAALERLVKLWENWDGLLMYLVATIARQSLTEDEEYVLRNLLLDVRYQFIQAEADQNLTRDFIRQQFVATWQELEPIFKRHLATGEAGLSRALGYLAFISAADALLVFDRLGPTFGLEISRNGLIRLAEMLHEDPMLLLHPSYISPDLQKLFRITPRQQEPAEEEAPPEGGTGNGAGIFKPGVPLGWLAGLLWSKEAVASQPSFQEILKWKVPDQDIHGYIDRVAAVLHNTSRRPEHLEHIPKNLHQMYHRLIKAMAWQESCFRQFVVKDKKLTYLISYNNTSVGLMQVNERIWRGLFSRNSLRWDIDYNAAAGCQIASMYLHKYGLRDRKTAAGLDDDTLARLVYAMYNGGPSQYQKFLARLKAGKLYDSDKLFWEKYQWVSAGQLKKVSICLVGS